MALILVTNPDVPFGRKADPLRPQSFYHDLGIETSVDPFWISTREEVLFQFQCLDQVLAEIAIELQIHENEFVN